MEKKKLKEHEDKRKAAMRDDGKGSLDEHKHDHDHEELDHFHENEKEDVH